MGRASSAKRPGLSDPEQPDLFSHDFWIGRGLAVAFMAALAIIVLGFTPYTYNLDVVKYPLFLCFGAMLLLASFVAMAHGVAPRPPRLVGAGLAAYGGVLLLSTILSDFSWAGWIHISFFVASAGFFLAGMAAGAVKQTSLTFFMFVGVLLLFVNLFGFFHYDLIGSGRTGMTMVYNSIYGDDPGMTRITPMRQLLFTFTGNPKSNLMSTIFNRDFYAGFCLLYMPIGASLALISNRWVWRTTGILTTLFSMVSIFLCKSKAEYFVAVAVLAFFLVFYVFAVRRSQVRGIFLSAWVGGMGVLMATLLFLNAPTLLSQLKSVSYSVSSRQIIYRGALKIYADFPVLGGGPGTFTIHFPRHRAIDYFNYEISNVTLYAHNYLLDILAETGTLGFVAYGVFALAIAFGAFRMLFKVEDTRLRLMLVACLAGLLGIYGSNMTSPNGRWPIGAVGLWSILGFTTGLTIQAAGWKSSRRAAEGRKAARNRPGEAWKGKPVLAFAALIALIALPFNIRESLRYWRAALSYNRGKQSFDLYRDRALESVIRPGEWTPDQRQFFFDRLTDAANNLRRASRIYPQHVSAYYQLGSTLSVLANFDPGISREILDESLQVYLDLEKLSPQYAELNYNLGIIYFRLSGELSGELANASSPEQRAKLEATIAEYKKRSLDYFDRMKDISRKADVLLRLGETYRDLGDFAEAQDIFRTGSDLYPDNQDLVKNFRLASIDLGDRRGEVEGALKLWRIFPGQSDLVYESSYGGLDLALEHGFDDLARQFIDEGLALNPVDVKLHERLFRLAERGVEAPPILSAALNYVKLGGADPEIVRRGAEIARELEDEEALARLQAVLDAPDNGEL